MSSSITDTLYEQGFANMVQADGRNAATVERGLSRPPPAAGGPARLAAEHLAAEGDGVATVAMAEPLRVGSAMLFTQEVMGNTVAPKRSVLATASSGGGGGMCGGAAERLAAEGDGVAATAMVEPLRVGSAL